MAHTQHDERIQSHSEPDSEHATDNASEGQTSAGERLQQTVDAGAEKLHEAQAQVAQEREPRWRVLLRGRYLATAYIFALVALALLALAAHANAVLPGDLPFTRELQESQSPVVYWPLYLISAIGFPVYSAIIDALAVLILWLMRLRLESVFLLASLLADALGGILKIVVGRHRPTPDLVHVVQQIQQPSFPSGHTLHYTVFYGFLFFVIATNFKSSWMRNSALVICALLVLLVGPSRVYLGEHWPTDVLGGYLVGALCLAPLILGYLWAKANLTITAAPPWIRRTPPASVEPHAER
jgi:membrane-associated phospholipid phosphatase